MFYKGFKGFGIDYDIILARFANWYIWANDVNKKAAHENVLPLNKSPVLIRGLYPYTLRGII
ncbi:hypothetical protein GCM10027516_19880 [Niabella aquatica]